MTFEDGKDLIRKQGINSFLCADKQLIIYNEYGELKDITHNNEINLLNEDIKEALNNNYEVYLLIPKTCYFIDLNIDDLKEFKDVNKVIRYLWCNDYILKHFSSSYFIYKIEKRNIFNNT